MRYITIMLFVLCLRNSAHNYPEVTGTSTEDLSSEATVRNGSEQDRRPLPLCIHEQFITAVDVLSNAVGQEAAMEERQELSWSHLP